MNIFLVEDNPVKRDQITSLVRSAVPTAQLTRLGSYNAALSLLQDQTPEVLILDMTLPTFDRVAGGREGRNRPLGGYEIMRKLKRRHVRSRVVVVSQFETFGEGDEKIGFPQLMEKCRKEFPDTFVEGIYFRIADSTWQAQLKNALVQLQGQS